MTQYEVIGIVIVGLSSIFGLFAIFVKLLISPINNLTNSVSNLDLTLRELSGKHDKLEERVDIHEERLDKIDIKIATKDKL